MNLVMSFFFIIKQKIWKLSYDKTMYDFERMLFYSLKTVFTEILKTRKLKWDIICVYKCISSHMKPLFIFLQYSSDLD